MERVSLPHFQVVRIVCRNGLPSSAADLWKVGADVCSRSGVKKAAECTSSIDMAVDRVPSNPSAGLYESIKPIYLHKYHYNCYHYHHSYYSYYSHYSPNSLLLGFLMQLEIWPPWCWLVWSVSWALKWSCLPLSPIVSGCLPLCGGWVLVGVAAFLGSEVVLSPVVSGCLPSCGGWGVVGVAASRTKIFRNQNHRFQSKFAYCKLFGVYAGVIFSFW